MCVVSNGVCNFGRKDMCSVPPAGGSETTGMNTYTSSDHTLTHMHRQTNTHALRHIMKEKLTKKSQSHFFTINKLINKIKQQKKRFTNKSEVEINNERRENYIKEWYTAHISCSNMMSMTFDSHSFSPHLPLSLTPDLSPFILRVSKGSWGLLRYISIWHSCINTSTL